MNYEERRDPRLARCEIPSQSHSDHLGSLLDPCTVFSCGGRVVEVSNFGSSGGSIRKETGDDPLLREFPKSYFVDHRLNERLYDVVSADEDPDTYQVFAKGSPGSTLGVLVPGFINKSMFNSIDLDFMSYESEVHRIKLRVSVDDHVSVSVRRLFGENDLKTDPVVQIVGKVVSLSVISRPKIEMYVLSVVSSSHSTPYDIVLTSEKANVRLGKPAGSNTLLSHVREILKEVIGTQPLYSTGAEKIDRKYISNQTKK